MPFRRESGHDPSSRAEAARSGVQYRGSARATSVRSGGWICRAPRDRTPLPLGFEVSGTETRERAEIDLHRTRRRRYAHAFVESQTKAYSAAVWAVELESAPSPALMAPQRA